MTMQNLYSGNQPEVRKCISIGAIFEFDFFLQ